MRTSSFSEEIAAKAKGDLLPQGPYLAELLGVDERRSKAGNEMLVCRWGIRHGETDIEILDHLTDAKRNALRLRHLAAVFEVLDKYEAGSLVPGDLTLGAVVTAHIVIERSPRPYPAKNAVADYGTAAVPPAVVTPLRMAG